MKFRSQSIDRLFDTILNLKTREDCYLYFEDLCTVKELQDMAQRLDVAVLLDEGMSYQKIMELVEVSTATIGRVSKTLALGSSTTRGVDANDADKVTDENLDQVIAWAKALAEKTGAVIVITGAIDIAANAEKAYVVRNGHPMMASITGSGCMLSAYMTAAICTGGDPLEACAQCLCAMGIAGERAYARLQALEGGNSTFRNLLIDEVYKLTDAVLAEEARYEAR